MTWTVRLLAPTLAGVLLLLGGCVGGPRPAAPPSTDLPSFSIAPDPNAEALFRSFVELDWQIIAKGGLGPAEDPPPELTDLMTGGALANSLDYYRWIHVQGVRVSGQQPTLVWVSGEPSDPSATMEACVDWTGVTMETDQLPPWQGRQRRVQVTVKPVTVEPGEAVTAKPGGAASKISYLRESSSTCNP